MKKAALILRDSNPWRPLVDEYFSEIEAHLSAGDASLHETDLVFIEPELCSKAAAQKINSLKNIKPGLRVFLLGRAAQETAHLFDFAFEENCDLFEFTKKISDKLPLPEAINLLIADDDAEILAMVSDYFENRHAPSFEVARAKNGQEALEKAMKKKPDAMILDVKMPLMSGREVYGALQKQKARIPTVIFFDAISVGELDAIKKAGKPVIVEKGYRESSMPYLLALVKKLVYFAS